LVGKAEHGKSIHTTSDFNYNIKLTEYMTSTATSHEVKRQRKKYKITSLQKNER